LIVDGDSVPLGRTRVLVLVDCVRDSIQGDRFVEQTVVGRPLYLNDHVIPGIALRRARNTRGNPPFVHVVIDVPFVAAGDAALVTPYEPLAELAPHELVDVKFERLRR